MYTGMAACGLSCGKIILFIRLVISFYSFISLFLKPKGAEDTQLWQRCCGFSLHASVTMQGKTRRDAQTAATAKYKTKKQALEN